MFLGLQILVFLAVNFILLMGWVYGSKSFRNILGILWLAIAGMALIHILSAQKDFTHQDAYGTYVIDRTMFPGRQADWQYDHYRLEIKKDDRFIFYHTDKERIIKQWEGTVAFPPGYTSPRIIISVDTPAHHILSDPQPTLYRRAWSFYYAFRSPLWGHVFFTKGKWKPIK